MELVIQEIYPDGAVRKAEGVSSYLAVRAGGESLAGAAAPDQELAAVLSYICGARLSN